SDGMYIAINLGGTAYVDTLATSPWILGIFTLPDFEAWKEQLAQITIEGTAASRANLASGTYPAARTLYVYANKERIGFSRGVFGNYVRLAMEPRYLNGKEPITWGFVPLEAADRQATLDTVDTLKELQY